MTYDELADYCKEASKTISELDYKNRILDKENQELKEKNEKEFADYIKFKKEQYDEYLKKINKLIKEKQELKKQLEDNSKINVADHKYASTCEDKVIILETQKKEFIKYLEDEIKELQKSKETELDYDILKDVISELLVFKDVLQKYKEIIGVKDENKYRLLTGQTVTFCTGERSKYKALLSMEKEEIVRRYFDLHNAYARLSRKIGDDK